MEQYIKYIQEKDQELIFHPNCETQVIEAILGETEGYQKLKAEHPEENPLPVEWVIREDPLLAQFSLQMFFRSKKIMPVDITHEDFIILWSNYTQTPDYFIQVANYMLNSDDYTSGARIKLKSEEAKTAAFPDGNLTENMRKLSGSFHGHPEEESRYVQKVASIGTDLFKVVQQ